MKKAIALSGLGVLLGTASMAQEKTPIYTVSEPPNIAFRSFDQTMIEFMEKRNVPGGALAVVKNGKLVYAQGYGYADLERKRRVRATTLFRIASISKPITGLAMMTLRQDPRYRLNLDSLAIPLLGVSPVLEAGKSSDPRLQKITVRHLLQHTAGFDRDKSGDPMFDPIQIAKATGSPAPASPLAIIRYMLGKPLDFDPGTRHAYSNFGYCLLGRIIEKVTGKPYETYVREAVLNPLGIQRMRLGKSLRSEAAAGEATYYQPNLGMADSVFPQGERQVPWAYGGFHLEAMDAHGGWLASAVDLARVAAYLDAPSGKPLLDADITREMYRRPEAPVGIDPDGSPAAAYYACGWMVRPIGDSGKANYWHTGSLPGTFTILVRRHDGISWAALFNKRSEGSDPSDMQLDAALHVAANAVKEWTANDLFGKYLR